MEELDRMQGQSLKRQSLTLLLLGVALVVGIFAGVLTASYLNLAAEQSLLTSIGQFLSAEGSPSFWQTVWKIFRMPLLVLLLGFTCFGVAATPIAIATQGFLFSFSVSAMVRLFGGRGLLLGVTTFGVQALVIIPCILIWGAQSIHISKTLFGMLFPKRAPLGAPVFLRGFVLALLLGLALLLIGTALEFWLTPHLVALTANGMIS